MISRKNSCAGREQALRLDLGRHRIVETGLRLLHVRDRDEADLEASLRLLELARDRLTRRYGRCEIVLGREHVEVAL